MTLSDFDVVHAGTPRCSVETEDVVADVADIADGDVKATAISARGAQDNRLIRATARSSDTS